MTDHERRTYEAKLLHDYYLHAMPENERDALAGPVVTLTLLPGVGDITAVHSLYKLGAFLARPEHKRWTRLRFMAGDG